MTKLKIDELCKCGHLMSEHNDRIIMVGGGVVSVDSVPIPNYGSCKQCQCQSYTWVKDVFREVVEA